MDRSRITLITVISAIFLAIIAYLASIIFSYPQSAEQGTVTLPDSDSSTAE